MLLVQRLHNPWLCFSSMIIQSLPDNRNPWFNLFFFFLSISSFSLLQLLPHLALNSTVSSCVSLGSVSTQIFLQRAAGLLPGSRCAIYLCWSIWASTQSCHCNTANLKKTNRLAASWQTAPPWQTREALHRRRGQGKGCEWGWQPRRSEQPTLSHAVAFRWV